MAANQDHGEDHNACQNNQEGQVRNHEHQQAQQEITDGLQAVHKAVAHLFAKAFLFHRRRGKLGDFFDAQVDGGIVHQVVVAAKLGSHIFQFIADLGQSFFNFQQIGHGGGLLHQLH